MEIKYVFLAFFNTYYSCYGRFLVAMVTYFMFSIFYLYILIGHDDTVILVYYTTFYMHSFIRGTPKPLKNVEKSSKLGRFLVAMDTLFYFFNFFLFILIGLDDTVILVCYTTFYMPSFLRGTPKPLKNVEKSSKIGCFLVAMDTHFYFLYFFLFILIGLDPPVILVYYTPFYIHSLICGNQKKTSRMGKML